MKQVVKLHSKMSLDAHRQTVETLRVEEMKASREEDKRMILAKIGDTDTFNVKVRHMLLNADSGLFSRWSSAVETAGILGKFS